GPDSSAFVGKVLLHISRDACPVLDLGDCSNLRLIELDQHDLVAQSLLYQDSRIWAELAEKTQNNFAQSQSSNYIESRRNPFQRSLRQSAQSIDRHDCKVVG